MDVGLSPARYVIGFLLVALATTFAFVVTSSASSILDESTVGEFGNWLGFMMPIAGAFTIIGGLLIGLPVYAYGRERGWFATVARSAIIGAVTGATFAGIIGILVVYRTADRILMLALDGAIAGAVAGALWWLVVARHDQRVSDA